MTPCSRPGFGLLPSRWSKNSEIVDVQILAGPTSLVFDIETLMKNSASLTIAVAGFGIIYLAAHVVSAETIT